MAEIKRYKAAAVQFNPALGKKRENIDILLEMSTEAAVNGAKLIVLPEMGTTGYCFYGREEISRFVEPVPGPTTKLFERICFSYNCYIVLGLPEVDFENGHYYNSCVLIGPAGYIGKYRKTHAFVAEPYWARDGDMGFPVFNTELGRIGCAICMDLFYFEPVRLLSLKGAEVICSPTNWCFEKAPAACWFTRAWENGVYLISSNRSDSERGIQFSGGSSIISPDGRLQSYLDAGQGIVYGEVDLGKTRDNHIGSLSSTRRRKPHLYHALTLNTYLYNPYFFHRCYDHHPLPQGEEFILAVSQFRPTRNNLAKNLHNIITMVEKAADSDTSLIVFPELSLTGPLSSYDEALNQAIQVPNDSIIEELITVAAKYKLHIVLGLAEKTQDKLYNTIVLIGKEGLVGKYRKVHLNKFDTLWACEGNNGFPWFNLPGARIGLLTADDTFLPESAMCQAVWGADIICVCGTVDEPKPHPLGATVLNLSEAYTEADPMHWHLWRTRAVETNTYVAFANQSNSGAIGYSGIFGPSDLPREEEVACGTHETLLTLPVKTGPEKGNYPQLLVRAKDQVRMRLPHLYDLLVLPASKIKQRG